MDSPAPPPDVLDTSAALSPHPLVASLAVTLADSAKVEVAYHAAAGPSLLISADSVSARHQMLLTRLRAATT
ncbi:MAG: hypothetical protein ABIS27_06990, partial [Longimicrobiales bacterium]